MLCSAMLVLVAWQSIAGVVITNEDVTIQGNYLNLLLNPANDGAIEELRYKRSERRLGRSRIWIGLIRRDRLRRRSFACSEFERPFGYLLDMKLGPFWKDIS